MQAGLYLNHPEAIAGGYCSGLHTVKFSKISNKNGPIAFSMGQLNKP